eukprot:2787792-Rhodomonas_salina.1
MIGALLVYWHSVTRRRGRCCKHYTTTCAVRRVSAYATDSVASSLSVASSHAPLALAQTRYSAA